MAKNIDIIKITNAFEKFTNPLRGLTLNEIDMLLSNARLGRDVKLQVAFSLIEKLTPIFLVCIQKRIAGVLERKWDIVPNDGQSDEQAKIVKKILLKSDNLNEDGLTEAIKWLCMASFRGRSAVKPFFDNNNNIYFKKIYNWNLLSINNKLYWNPSSDSGYDEKVLEEVPKNEVCILYEDNAIDYPGLMIYLRQLVGENLWARFVEKEGIPLIVLVPPDGTSDTDLQKWSLRAALLFEGGSGVIPAGGQVNQLTAARGQDPFSEYIKHLMELISILATGGTLLTIGGSTGLGSDLATVQRKQFDLLVSQDCKKISNAITDSILTKICNLFNLGPCNCRFTYIEDNDTSITEYLEYATKCKELGIAIDITELKRITNLSFIKDNQDLVWLPITEEDKVNE